jgi:hypothetical protein
LSGLVCIPDSVEVLSFHGDKRYSVSRTLSLGTESRLAETRRVSDREFFSTRSFLQLSSRILKHFRTKLEF